MMVAALGLILLLVILGPVLSKTVERNIEIFFLAAGALTAAVSGQLSWAVLKAALTEPIALAIAVLVFGIIARFIRSALDRSVEQLLSVMAAHWVYFILIVALGMLASIITAVIAALILGEAITMLKLDRRSEVDAVVLACFAIGLGAGLTPVGEPLSTIAISALQADFWYLARLLGPFIGVGILILGIASLVFPVWHGESLKASRDGQSWREIVLRAVKIYLFVAGLVGLSWGMRPLANAYISRVPESLLFWLNSVSAVVDNATLAAVEIGPALSPGQQRSILMALLISGGMLIPGNIPNIVAAGRLNIGSREWARTGLLIGLPLMALCFAALKWIG
jgi:predicted cation transporter